MPPWIPFLPAPQVQLSRPSLGLGWFQVHGLGAMRVPARELVSPLRVCQGHSANLALPLVQEVLSCSECPLLREAGVQEGGAGTLQGTLQENHVLMLLPKGTFTAAWTHLNKEDATSAPTGTPGRSAAALTPGLGRVRAQEGRPAHSRRH